MNVQHDDRPKRLCGGKECWMKKKEKEREREREEGGKKERELRWSEVSKGRHRHSIHSLTALARLACGSHAGDRPSEGQAQSPLVRKALGLLALA
jgi:hypothetical protein